MEATVFEMERLRCNARGQVFAADEPETAGADKYEETAVAMIALLKYGTGVPFQRLERLQERNHVTMKKPRETRFARPALRTKPSSIPGLKSPANLAL